MPGEAFAGGEDAEDFGGAGVDDYPGSDGIPGGAAGEWEGGVVCSGEAEGDEVVGAGGAGAVFEDLEEGGVGVGHGDVGEAVAVEVCDHGGAAVGDAIGGADAGDVGEAAVAEVEEGAVALVAAVRVGGVGVFRAFGVFDEVAHRATGAVAVAPPLRGGEVTL